MTFTASLLAAALAVPLAPAPAPPLPAPGPDGVVRAEEERDFNDPPEGAPEDRALWRELRDGTSGATVEMARVAQCAYRIRYDKHYELLDTMAEKGTPEQVARAKELRARLEADAKGADAALPKSGPSVRMCRYTLLFLEQRMSEPRGSKLAKELPATRKDARKCADDMRAMVGALQPRADALEATLAEIDGFLGRSPSPRPKQPASFTEPLQGAADATPASAASGR